MTFKKFIPPFFLVTTLTGGGAFRLTEQFGLDQNVAASFIVTAWIFFVVVTGIAVFFSLRAMQQQKFAMFQGVFMGALLLKVIGAGVIVLVYSMMDGETDQRILWPLMTIYVPFLILETVFLSRASKAYDQAAKAAKKEGGSQ